jgi:hypothetical protein
LHLLLTPIQPKSLSTFRCFSIFLSQVTTPLRSSTCDPTSVAWLAPEVSRRATYRLAKAVTSVSVLRSLNMDLK